MIILQKTGRNVATLKIDKEGGERLLSALSSVRTQNAPADLLGVLVDASLLGKRGRDVHTCVLRFELQEPGRPDGEITCNGSVMLWKLVESDGEVDYAVAQLGDAVRLGYFSPAEFLMVRAPKFRELIQIYVEFLGPSTSGA